MDLPNNPRDFNVARQLWLDQFGDLFTPRQLVALTTFSDLVPEAIARIRADAQAAGMPDDGRGLDAGGNGATAYAEAVGVFWPLVSKLIGVTR
jgi:putative DNA methylase